MQKIKTDLDKYFVYKHIPTAGLVAFDASGARQIRETLSENGKIFHQVPAEIKLMGQFFKLDIKFNAFILSEDIDIVKIQDLERLPILTRIRLDIKKVLRL